MRATNLSVGEVRFGECIASGRMRGDVFEGEVLTRAPDSRLAWSVSLREPFGFRLEGPFSLGDPGNGTAKNGNRRFSLHGRAQIEGAFRAVEKTSGTVLVESLNYRDGGFELSGKDLSARMDPAGVRWTGGTIVAAGNPVRISGMVSWGGTLDVRVEGKLPASAVRLAVPSVFDRLDGMVTLEARVTGKRDAPSIVGTGHLEGGTLSFIGYNQLFEGIRADAVISREKIVFEHFEGKSGGGYIDGWGEVPLKMDAGQRLYFSVDFLDVRYPYPDEFRPVVQGHAELLGPVDDLLVTGDIEVQSARYTKTLRLEKALVDFGKRLFDVSARREKSDFRVRLDISAIADGTIRIRNNLADAIAKGEFRIVGDTSRVIVLGSFDVVEGTVEFSGNKYEVKRATVDFQDPRRNNPRLDVRAETKKGNVIVTVTVTGTLEKYEVDLFSDPPLGKNDIVALLSLGVTTQALAGQEGAVGSAAAASIALGPVQGGRRGEDPRGRRAGPVRHRTGILLDHEDVRTEVHRGEIVRGPGLRFHGHERRHVGRRHRHRRIQTSRTHLPPGHLAKRQHHPGGGPRRRPQVPLPVSTVEGLLSWKGVRSSRSSWRRRSSSSFAGPPLRPNPPRRLPPGPSSPRSLSRCRPRS